MKLKVFLVVSAIVALIYAVISLFVSGNFAALPVWSVAVSVGAVIPAIIAFIAQREGLKNFVRDYLSLKNTDWRKVVVIVGATTILLPIIKAIIIVLTSNILGINTFGCFTSSFHTQLFGFIPYSGSTATDILLAGAAQIVYLFIWGSIIGIFSCIFEEIAWRGFMVRYLNGSLIVKSIIIAVVWTLWTLAMTYTYTTWLNAAMLLILNVLLSYYLVRIARATGSVWACAMVRGIFNLGALSFCIMPGTPIGERTMSIFIVFIIMCVVSVWLKPRD